MKLVTSDTNWADEMDLWGFEVVGDAYYKVAMEVLNYAFNDVGISVSKCVGTNEDIEFNDYDDVKRAFTAKDIKEDEVKIFKRLFQSTYGGFAVFTEVVDSVMYEIEGEERYEEFQKKFKEAREEDKAKKAK